MRQPQHCHADRASTTPNSNPHGVCRVLPQTLPAASETPGRPEITTSHTISTAPHHRLNSFRTYLAARAPVPCAHAALLQPTSPSLAPPTRRDTHKLNSAQSRRPQQTAAVVSDKLQVKLHPLTNSACVRKACPGAQRQRGATLTSTSSFAMLHLW